ncbi:transposase [Aeromonas hydrophila]|uniref:DNA-binding protein n=1 Tax=Aeromonas hydrophila TaxID=644 RepID=UPI00101AFA5A|nr:DNA-binding protein [Aeromonas hydrophila]BBG84599.1 transposase [Aeromonas hydrophila]BBT61918.1 transposase [Aeromonas hydrophila]
MSTWYTAQALAGLAGMPAYPDGVRKKAEREEWQSRKREKGKGAEYHISSLPIETRRYLAERAVAEQGQAVTDHAAGGKAMAKLLAREVPVKPDAGRKLLTLGERARQKVDARLLILQAADIFLAPYQACQQGEVGRRAFIEAYRARSLSLPASLYDRQKPFSLITLRRWQSALADEGPAALAGNYQRERSSTVEQSPELAQFLTALVTAKPHLANKWGALHELASQYNEMNQLGWHIPSQSSLRRWMAKWLSDNRVAFTYATNPDAYNNKYRSAIEEMYPWMAQPNDVWEFDSTPVDAMLVDGRHSIIAVIDVFTRRVRLLVAKTSSSEGICLLLRKTLLAWGTLNDNGVMRTDNGSDYVSQRVMSICALLGMNVSRSNAYSGWEKPHIERFFRTLSHGLIELLPSYIGHCVADRQVIEARKSFAQRLEEKRKPDAEKEIFELAMTACELQSLLDNWLDARYHNRKHGSLGMTPNEKYGHTRYQRRAIPDESALDLLLNHIGEATVSKGFIKAGGLKYTAPELLEHNWKSQRVSVFLDPSDVGRAILYRTGDWNERIEAVNIELLGNGVSPDAFRATKRADAKALAGFRREMRNLAKSFGIDQLHQDVVRHFVSQARDIAQFQLNDLTLDNPALAALSGIAAPAEPAQFSAAELAAIEARREEKAARAQVTAGQESRALKTEYEQAIYLAEKELEKPLAEREKEWLTRYLYSHKLMAKRINRHLDQVRATRSAQAKG